MANSKAISAAEAYTLKYALELVREANRLNGIIKEQEYGIDRIATSVEYGRVKGSKASKANGFSTTYGSFGYTVSLKTVRGTSFLVATVKGTGAGQYAVKMTGKQDGLIKMAGLESDIPLEEASNALRDTVARGVWNYLKAIHMDSKKYANVLKDYCRVLEHRVEHARMAIDAIEACLDAEELAAEEKEAREEKTA